MPTSLHADALASLLTLARQLTQANMVAALVQRGADEVLPLRSEPRLGLRHSVVWRWQLPSAPAGGTTGLQPLSLDQVPSLILTALPFTPATAAYLDCSAWGEHVVGGLLLLWDAARAPHAAAQMAATAAPESALLLLRPIYGRLLEGREQVQRAVDSRAQFRDIFNSVRQGIVVVPGEGAQAQVNQVASTLLRVPLGAVAVDVLAQSMRATRSRCDNAAELDAAYLPLQRTLDAEVVVDWQLDDQVWRVDTHPILHSGHNGRVWLFQDVTAQIRLEQMLRREATHDALTGLFNRRAFFDRAQVHYQVDHPVGPQAADPAQPPAARQLALLMFDIDHFKQVNDSFGHPVGDQVLREVAQRAQALLRDGDVLARYGGEEFILLFGPATLAEAHAMAERLRLAMQAEPVQAGALAIAVHISVGVTLRRGGHEVRETLARTIERADSHLYRAKREGRNRVVSDAD